MSHTQTLARTRTWACSSTTRMGNHAAPHPTPGNYPCIKMPANPHPARHVMGERQSWPKKRSRKGASWVRRNDVIWE